MLKNHHHNIKYKSYLNLHINFHSILFIRLNNSFLLHHSNNKNIRLICNSYKRQNFHSKSPDLVKYSIILDLHNNFHSNLNSQIDSSFAIKYYNNFKFHNHCNIHLYLNCLKYNHSILGYLHHNNCKINH